MAVNLSRTAFLLLVLIQVCLSLLQYHTLFRTESSKGLSQTSIKAVEGVDLQHVERVFAISDLHIDNPINLSWLKEHCQTQLADGPGSKDVLIIAGDVSHEISKLVEAFSIIRQGLKCNIFFVPGNHEAWIGGHELDSYSIHTSLDKLDAVKDMCRDMGVHTDPAIIGVQHNHPAWILPMESWYDGSLALQGCGDLCQDFAKWPWTDFLRCKWPQEYQTVPHLGKIPIGLGDMFLKKNEIGIQRVHESFLHWESSSTKHLGLITFSHFLPNSQTLPDWKNPQSDVFMRSEWLSHPVPEISAKFAKVAGSINLEKQIRSILPSQTAISLHSSNRHQIHHTHVFGHSHRPKDFTLKDIRYIHNPLGKPVERDMNLIPRDVNFKLIWDCRSGGNVQGKTIVRYWEENGGIYNPERMKPQPMRSFPVQTGKSAPVAYSVKQVE